MAKKRLLQHWSLTRLFDAPVIRGFDPYRGIWVTDRVVWQTGIKHKGQDRYFYFGENGRYICLNQNTDPEAWDLGDSRSQETELIEGI